jgi:hypothetical protein
VVGGSQYASGLANWWAGGQQPGGSVGGGLVGLQGSGECVSGLAINAFYNIEKVPLYFSVPWLFYVLLFLDIILLWSESLLLSFQFL